MKNYDAVIFDNILVALLVICPAMLALDPLIRIVGTFGTGSGLQREGANPIGDNGVGSLVLGCHSDVSSHF